MSALAIAILTLVLGLNLSGCTSAKMSENKSAQREVAGIGDISDAEINLVVDRLVIGAATMDCRKTLDANKEIDSTKVRLAMTAVIKNWNRLTNLDRKFKAINPEFHLTEISYDDVPKAIQTRGMAANFKLSLGRRWILFIVQDSSNPFCNQSGPS